LRLLDETNRVTLEFQSSVTWGCCSIKRRLSASSATRAIFYTGEDFDGFVITKSDGTTVTV
jgi:hypothetical protein